MAGTWVGSTDYSALGAGKSHDAYDNQLTEAPEEEEDFDVLNDETFGDFGNDVEFDWEEQHEKFAETLESNGDRTHDSGFNTAEKTYRNQEEYMEHSISQLMVDDEEMEDPAIVNARKAHPIPKKQQSLDSLFGPSSPPSFLDTEHLVSPTSKNIWGSPIVEQNSRPKPVSNIQSLFAFAKAASTDSPVPTSSTHSKTLMVLPRAQTLEEIESSLLSKAKVMTAEELERQMRGERSRSRYDNLSRLNGHPVAHPTHLPPPNLPPGMGVTPPRTMPPRLPPPGMSPARSPGMSPGVLPMMNGRVSPLQGAIIPLGSTPPYKGMAGPGNRQSPAGTPGRNFSQPIGIPANMRGPPVCSPYNSPQGLYGSPQGPYQSPQHQRIPMHSGSSDPSHMRNMQDRPVNQIHFMSPSLRGAYQNRNNNNRDISREHRYHRPPYNRGGDCENSMKRYTTRSDDEFVGIMTQKEKDWIIKIQLLQLQTDNPYLDDFYYTTYSIRKKVKENEKDGTATVDDPKLVIPAMVKVENRSYKPAQFEGSLGRLTTSSVHNPRQIIDLLAKSVSETAGTARLKTNVGKELRKSRQLLMDIEKGYNLLLEVGDIEMKILALPEDARVPLFEDRAYKIDLLFHYLLCDGNSAAFMQYMNVRKGRLLTARALPLLDKVQSVGIVSLIFKNLQQLMRKEDPEDDLEKMFEPCARVIDTCNLATIVMYTEDIQHEESQSQSKPIAVAIQNKLGSSLVSCLLHRGEEIYSSTSPVDMESILQEEWLQFVNDFATILAVIPSESVMCPIRTYPNIESHMERLLNKRLMAVIEDKMLMFTGRDTEKNS